MNVLRVKFATIEEAEVNFGLTINSILHGTSEPAESPKVTTAFHNVNILTELKNLGVGELVHVLKGTLQLLEPGRAMLPIRHKATIRQRLHKPEMGLPPVPNHMALG